MCLIALHVPTSASDPLVVIANRDEVLSRPTAPLHRWTDGSGIVAGADLEAGGTWMGVHPEHGRVAMVTNVRDPRDLQPRRASEPSRGALVRDFLVGELSADRFVAQAHRASMRGFNLIAIDRAGAHWCSNRGGAPTRLRGGIHGVSNALLDTPWPKVVRAKEALEHAMRRAERDDEAFFAILADDRRASDDELPDTGVGLELERALSPIRIAMPGYGTRASTVLVVHEGAFRLVERTIAPTPTSSTGEVAIEGRFGR